MNEKSLKILEQYELEVKSVRRGRDSYIAETDRGLVLLREYNGSNQRAAWIENVCRKVRSSGMVAELPIANREGSFVSSDRDSQRYLVKLWISGREPDSRNTQEIAGGVRNLAGLHKVLGGFPLEHAVVLPEPQQVYEKRMRELGRIFRYVKEKKRKNEFELRFLNEYGYFHELCVRAQQRAKEHKAVQAWHTSAMRGDVCHGDYNQHNILRQDSGYATVHFENAAVGCQMMDLYSFMRKMLEKNGWNISYADTLLQAYMEIKPLTEEELEQLYIQFEFSEKFWKIANHYYNSRKTWIPDRSLLKLEKLVSLAPKQAAFLKYFQNTYLV